MEIYGIAMREAHGEEAAGRAFLEEVAHDLDQELQRFMNPGVRGLSPHVGATLRHARGSSSEEAGNTGRGQWDGCLLRAWPLDRADNARRWPPSRIQTATGAGATPFDAFMNARMIVHRHMRLAFEGGAGWLMEMLEEDRPEVAARAAYALALEREAGLRPEHE